MLVSLQVERERVVRHTSQAGNQPIAAAEDARRATTGRVWAAFMIVGGRV